MWHLWVFRKLLLCELEFLSVKGTIPFKVVVRCLVWCKVINWGYYYCYQRHKDPRSGGWGPAQPLPKCLHDQLWEVRAVKGLCVSPVPPHLQPLALAAHLPILLNGLQGRWNSCEAPERFCRVPCCRRASNCVPECARHLCGHPGNLATPGGSEQWLMMPQTSVTAVETGLPVAPPALVTSPGEPAWTLSWCTVAGRQQRAPLAWTGSANRPQSTEKWNSPSPAVATLTAAPSTFLLILKHRVCLTSVCSWLHHLPCLLGTARGFFTTSEWRGSFGLGGDSSPRKPGDGLPSLL